MYIELRPRGVDVFSDACRVMDSLNKRMSLQAMVPVKNGSSHGLKLILYFYAQKPDFQHKPCFFQTALTKMQAKENVTLFPKLHAMFSLAICTLSGKSYSSSSASIR